MAYVREFNGRELLGLEKSATTCVYKCACCINNCVLLLWRQLDDDCKYNSKSNQSVNSKLISLS